MERLFMNLDRNSLCVLVAIAAFAALPALAEDSEAEIAKKSQNPVASLISVPLKLDYDRNIGPLQQGDKYQLTVQPVIPFSIGENWNLISRTLVPLVDQKNV